MAFQPLEDGLKCVIEYGKSPDFWTNTIYVTKPDYDEADQFVQANNIMDIFENLADIYLCANWQLIRVTSYDMRSEVAPVVYSTRDAYDGAIVGSAGPLNIALVMSFYSAQRGRSGRGRNYLTGFIEDDTGATEVEDTVMVANINTFFGGLAASIALGDWTWVIASGQQGGIILPELIGYPVTGAYARNAIFGTQRRRVDRP